MDDKKPAVTSSKAKSSTGLFDDDDDDSAAATIIIEILLEMQMMMMNKKIVQVQSVYLEPSREGTYRTSLFGSSDEEVDESDPLFSQYIECYGKIRVPLNSEFKSLFGSTMRKMIRCVQKETLSVEKPKEKETSSSLFVMMMRRRSKRHPNRKRRRRPRVCSVMRGEEVKETPKTEREGDFFEFVR